ncbi:hypothetical protein [Gemmata sp.]|uniref:hypothetical protein n=1 Tax=Gemmata sp. TaxID=1914242 RepID=UPI003F72C609
MRSVATAALFLALPLAAAAQDKGTETKIGGLKATAPADWKKEKPANLLRSYQFRLPEVKDLPGAEVAVFPESHPNPDKSFPKWKNQFVPPEGKTIDDIAKVSKWDVKGATVTVLDVTGTWKYKERPQDPASKEMLLDNYRVVWVIVGENDEATHVRLSGPAGSVEAQFKAFEGWVKALK